MNELQRIGSASIARCALPVNQLTALPGEFAKEKSMEPMQTFLSGWLQGVLSTEGSNVMKISRINYQCHSDTCDEHFDVHFASGLILRVTIEVVKESLMPGQSAS